MTQQFPDQMVSRLRPADTSGSITMPEPATAPGASQARKLEFRIEIPAEDGTMLLVLREENGCLVVEGDESRWDEGAKRFLHAMMQWSGLAGIRWQDEVRKAAGG